MSLLKNVPYFSQEITIVINEDDPELTRKFNVTQGLLVEHSAFFEAACRNEWQEATTRTIKLPDVNNETFSAYLYWIYKEKIPFDTDCDRGDWPYVYDYEAVPTLEEIIKLWLLADRLLTAKLRNAAADAILRILELLSDDSEMDEVFPASMIALIWPATTKDRAIRRIVVDFYAYYARPEAVESSIENYHPDFVKDLVLTCLSVNEDSGRHHHPTSQKFGHYHELDKPHPRSNIHGTAEIDIKDKDGVVLRYETSLFATPQEYMDAVHKYVGRSNTPEVEVQIKDDVWAVVKEDNWSESFGKIAESSHFERVSIVMVFDLCKFPEKMRLPGKRLHSC